MMDSHQQELHREAERAFQESLDRLRDAPKKKPDPSGDRVPDPKPQSSVRIDPKEWEDAVADIDRYLSSRSLKPWDES